MGSPRPCMLNQLPDPSVQDCCWAPGPNPSAGARRRRRRHQARGVQSWQMAAGGAVPGPHPGMWEWEGRVPRLLGPNPSGRGWCQALSGSILVCQAGRGQCCVPQGPIQAGRGVARPSGVQSQRGSVCGAASVMHTSYGPFICPVGQKVETTDLNTCCIQEIWL